jgi:phage head maturation protease
MKFKECPAFKVAPDGGDNSGEFEAIVSVFGNIDRVGDVVFPGAFADSLATWKSSGDPIPVLWSHRMDDPRYSIGAVLEAEELEPGDKRIPEWASQHVKDNGGLWVRAQLHSDGEIALAARKLLQARLVKQFSFAYDIVDAEWVTVDGRDAYGLKRLDIFEVSPTQVGANDLTELVGAKAAASLVASRSGPDLAELVRVAGSISDQLKAAVDAIGHRPLRSDDTTEGEPVKAEEPAGVKAEEPSRAAGSVRLRCEIERLRSDLD